MTDVLLSRDMTPEEFRGWYDRLRAIDPGLTHTKLATRLDVDQPRIGKWLKGKVAISGYLWRALEHLAAELEAERKPKKRRPPNPAARASARQEEDGGE